MDRFCDHSCQPEGHFHRLTQDEVDLSGLVTQAELRYYYATKAELESLKVWIVCTGFFALTIIAGLVIAVVALW